MAVAVRRVFRIERSGREEAAAPASGAGNAEIMAAIAELRAEIAARPAGPGPSAADLKASEAAREMLDLYKAELAEARKLKRELDAITEAITRTKQEIAALHQSGQAGGAMHRVTDELDAVVGGTEGATNTILAAAESIDDAAKTLTAKLSGDDQGIAGDIQDQVVAIFEACNFQDLTGQRITKVVNVLRFVEDRVARMTEIWGGLTSFAGIAPAVEEAEIGEEAGLLNGPALPEDEGRATQAMIDALFD